MSVASIFEFRFSPETTDEGFKVAQGIGADMPPTEGYLAHQVIRDVADAGHIVVITHWSKQSEAVAVLSEYRHDAKVARATELLGKEPSGFMGEDFSGSN